MGGICNQQECIKESLKGCMSWKKNNLRLTQSIFGPYKCYYHDVLCSNNNDTKRKDPNVDVQVGEEGETLGSSAIKPGLLRPVRYFPLDNVCGTIC